MPSSEWAARSCVAPWPTSRSGRSRAPARAVRTAETWNDGDRPGVGRLMSPARFILATVLVIACGGIGATSPDSGSVVIATDPAAAQIVTSDLAHFWAAY